MRIPLRRPLACLLGSALILTAPGLGVYTALARQLAAPASAKVSPISALGALAPAQNPDLSVGGLSLSSLAAAQGPRGIPFGLKAEAQSAVVPAAATESPAAAEQGEELSALPRAHGRAARGESADLREPAAQRARGMNREPLQEIRKDPRKATWGLLAAFFDRASSRASAEGGTPRTDAPRASAPRGGIRAWIFPSRLARQGRGSRAPPAPGSGSARLAGAAAGLGLWTLFPRMAQAAGEAVSSAEQWFAPSLFWAAGLGVAFVLGATAWIARSLAQKGRTSDESIVRGYLRGMFAYNLSYATNYSLFTQLALYVVGPYGPAIGRFAQNLAPIFVSPIGGAWLKRVPLRAILIGGVLGRLAVYSGLAYARSVFPEHLMGIFALLMLLDGAIVAVHGLAGPDYSGTTLLQRQYGVRINSDARNRISTVFFAGLDLLRMIWVPAIAGIVSLLTGLTGSVAGAFLFGMVASYVVASVAAVYYYTRYIPDGARARVERVTLAQARGELSKGLQAVKGDDRIRWTGVWLAINRSMNDAMLAIVLPMIAIKVLATKHDAWTAATAILLPAVAKLGAIIASYAQKAWKAPASPQERYARYRVFFAKPLIGTFAALLLLPATLWGSFWPAVSLAGLSGILFSYNLERAQQGLRHYYQELGKDAHADNSVLMGLLLAGIMAASLLFVVGPAAFLGGSFPVFPVLSAVLGIFLSVGFIHWKMAPKLYFSPEERARSADFRSPR